MNEDILNEIERCMVNLDRECVIEKIKEALSHGIKASEVVMGPLSKAMEEIGKLYENGDYFVAELLEAASIFKNVMEFLKDKLEADVSVSKSGKRAKIVIGTVKGDIHDIGKTLVSIMLQAAGHEVIDLGIDVPAEKFIDAYYKYKPQIIAMSALLTTTAMYMKTVIDKFVEAGLRKKVKIIIGGAATSEDFAKEIGADGWAPNAIKAVELVNKLIEELE
ncbi:MAG: cobalamin-dependent protein [Desulfurococcaceae archaeon]